MRRVTPWLISLLALVGALALAGCGDGGGGDTTTAATPTATGGADATATVQESVKKLYAAPFRSELTTRTTIDASDAPEQVREALGSQGDTTVTGTQAFESRERFEGTVEAAAPVGTIRIVGYDGKTYFSRSSGPFRQATGDVAAYFAQLNSQELLDQSLENLQGLTKVGTEDLDGTSVDKYSGTIDPAFIQEQFEKTLATTGLSGFPTEAISIDDVTFDVYVDPATGTAVRQDTTSTIGLDLSKVPGAADQGIEGTLRVTTASEVTYTDQGATDITVTRPTPSGTVSSLQEAFT